MLSERLNFWIFILFGRGLGSVNRTDFVQHMLRKNLEALKKYKLGSSILQKGRKKIFKMFWSF
jgi:hypothetical protein